MSFNHPRQQDFHTITQAEGKEGYQGTHLPQGLLDPAGEEWLRAVGAGPVWGH